MSWMQKLRDAKTGPRSSDLVEEGLNAFLDHFQGRSVWTNKMVPICVRRMCAPPKDMRIIKGPEKSKIAQGVHVHYCLDARLIMFSTPTFLSFMRAHKGCNVNETLIMSELRGKFHATDHRARMFRGTPWQHVDTCRFLAIPVPAGSILERRLFGENSPAVENAMKVFEEALERRREKERKESK